MKHKHADLIHAWADGAEIQHKRRDHQWYDCTSPNWNTNVEYRIKPEEKKPVVRWLWADKYGNITNRMYTESEAKEQIASAIKLEWSRTEFPE